jgi:branched-chain amino acid transport system substrate-binding protein
VNRAFGLSGMAWLTVAAIVCASCSAAPDHSVGQVRVGLLVPLTGPDGAAGKRRLQAAQLAVDLLNQHRVLKPPGTGTARFVLRSSDTAGDPDRAQEQARQLASAGVAGIVSADDAEDTQRVAPAAQDRGVPLISAVASANYLGELADPVLFRVGPTDTQLTQAVLSMVTQHSPGNPPRIGVISTGPDDADVVASFTDQATLAGAPLDVVDTGDGDITGGVRRMLADHPEVVVAAASTPQKAGDLLSALAHRGVPTVFGLGAGFNAAEFQDTTSTVVLRPVPWSADPRSHNQLTTDLATPYQRRYRAPMTSDVAETIAAVLVLAVGVGQAHSASPAQVAQLLAGLNLGALSLPVPWALDFDQVHNNTRAGAVIEQLGAGAGARSVYPPELASGAPATFTTTTAAASPRSPARGLIQAARPLRMATTRCLI